MSEEEKTNAARRFPAEWILLPAGIVMLAFVVWWPASSPTISPEEKMGYAPYPDVPPAPATLPGDSPKDEKRGRQLIQLLRWIPSGFPLAIAVDLGAARRYPWTRLFSVLFDNPVFHRHLDILQLDADGFEWLGIGALPTAPPVYWNGKSLQFTFVPHVFFLRGREGRMQVLRRFWQAGRRSQEGLQVGQYQLVFPLRREPHLVIGGWKADIRAPLDMVEETRSLQSFCTAQNCDKHIPEINPWAHFVGAYAPAAPIRLAPGISIRTVWVTGEWNMDGLLLQARLLPTGNCEELRRRLLPLLDRQGTALQMDAAILHRIHAVCGHDAALHLSLPLTAAEIRKQWMILGIQQKL